MIRVLLIGRPNVGKSTLFNRLCGTRRALVHHTPGTTRDVNYDRITIGRRRYIITDSAGWAENDAIFSTDIRLHLERALTATDIAVLVVDGKAGLQAADRQVAALVRQQGKPTIIAVNKIDSHKDEAKAAEFFELGFDTIIPVSATHGRNMPELTAAIGSTPVAHESPDEPATDGQIAVILVGKPNVGKSSLMNRLSGEERSIVHDQPGTTREALDTTIIRGDNRYVLIDTPGLHRRHKFTNDLEYLAALSTNHALERADVAVLVLDVSQGIGETEARIAEMVLENRCACLIVVNKWDLPDDRESAVADITRQIEQKLQFLAWARVVLVSAKSGQRVERILDEVNTTYAQYARRIPQEDLNELLRTAEHRRPLSRQGHVLRLHRMEQLDVCPPMFQITVNDPLLVHFSYRRYLENRLRESFGFTGTPLSLKFKKL